MDMLWGDEADELLGKVGNGRIAVLWTVQVLLFVGARRLFRLMTTPKHVVPPRQTWLVVLLNWLLWPACLLADYVRYKVPVVGRMLVRPLSLERLALLAEKRTGLKDWGKQEEGFPALYEAAIERLNEVVPSPLGRLITFDYVLRRLMTRLEVIENAKKRPERPELTKEPVFVMGLPRTGTTLLHRLLALDPAARYPKTYELLDPLNSRNFSKEKRVAYLDKRLGLVKKLIPHIEAIHELGAEEAEECLLGLSVEVPLLPPTFRHLVRHCVQQKNDTPTPTSVSFPDFSNAYRLYKRQLQFLMEEDAEPKRWVLKCPAHLGFVSDLTSVFTDAKLVWTHRDPRDSLPSLGSLFRTFADMCEANDVNLHAIGNEQLLYWSAALARARRDTANLPKGRVAHVAFDDLMADPIQAVSRIYATFGWTVSPAFLANMQDYLAKNHAQRTAVPKHLKAFHQYSLQEYGLDADHVKRTIGRDYYDAFLPGKF